MFFDANDGFSLGAQDKKGLALFRNAGMKMVTGSRLAV
jgi:hypothetical protein